jgi:hypothetical protein
MFGSFPPSPLVDLRLQSLLGPGSRHCYGIITLKTSLLALWDIAVFEWWNAPLPFVLLYLANDFPPVIAGQQCSDGRSQRGTGRRADLSSAAIYEPMKKDKTAESEQGRGKSIHGLILTPQIHHTE